VEKLEKLDPRAGAIVQTSRLTFKVGNCVTQNMWGKPPYSLFGNCRG
jgi:hypothetical protein